MSARRLLERAPLPDIDEDLVCDPGGKTAGEEMFELKRTVEAKKNDMADIVTWNKLHKSVKWHHEQRYPRTFGQTSE